MEHSDSPLFYVPTQCGGSMDTGQACNYFSPLIACKYAADVYDTLEQPIPYGKTTVFHPVPLIYLSD